MGDMFVSSLRKFIIELYAKENEAVFWRSVIGNVSFIFIFVL